jgi:DNA-binding NarL/FixJ family response regulator
VGTRAIATQRKHHSEPAGPTLEQLTPRQRDILRLVALGHTNREIATLLEISVRTVEVHRFNLMRRLEVRNVAQLLRRALQMGLLSKNFGAK